MTKEDTKKKAVSLRLKGESYSNIIDTIGIKVPKSTLSYWFRHIDLSDEVLSAKKIENINHLALAREQAQKSLAIRKQKYFEEIEKTNSNLLQIFSNIDVYKITLSTLYLAEGSKRRSALVFCNSDPYIIKLFLHLLRACYRLDEEKFRCTIQCRADQNIVYLESFWSTITNIPLSKFYKTRIDKRSIGKLTQKNDYKGVCRIDYFSAHICHELAIIPKIIFKGH